MLIKKLRILLVIIITTITSVSCCMPGNNPKIYAPELPPPAKPIKNVKVALVLSSGGFRGVSHIGVLEVLEENHIDVDLVVGSSAGSIVGALYCADPSASSLKQKLMFANYKSFVDASWVNTMKSPFSPTGPIKGRALQNFMLKNLKAHDFDDLKIPLVVVTTNLINNKRDTIQSGPIIPAVHASMALPPYFAPVKLYQNVYTDGGVISPVPVEVAKMFHPKMIIAVDISRKPSLTQLKNAFHITGRAMDISFYQLAQTQAKEADFVIRPDITGFGPFEDDYNYEFYVAGKRAAQAKIAEIKKAFLKIK